MMEKGQWRGGRGGVWRAFSDLGGGRRKKRRWRRKRRKRRMMMMIMVRKNEGQVWSLCGRGGERWSEGRVEGLEGKRKRKNRKKRKKRKRKKRRKKKRRGWGRLFCVGHRGGKEL